MRNKTKKIIVALLLIFYVTDILGGLVFQGIHYVDHILEHLLDTHHTHSKKLLANISHEHGSSSHSHGDIIDKVLLNVAHDSKDEDHHDALMILASKFSDHLKKMGYDYFSDQLLSSGKLFLDNILLLPQSLIEPPTPPPRTSQYYII